MEFALARLGRGFETVAFRVIEPAMIRASNAAGFDPAIGERRAAVLAAIVDETDITALVAEQDQRLAENPHRLCRIVRSQLVRHTDWQPVTAQQFAGRRSGPHLG